MQYIESPRFAFDLTWIYIKDFKAYFLEGLGTVQGVLQSWTDQKRHTPEAEGQGVQVVCTECGGVCQ